MEMAKELYVAAKRGNIQFLEEIDDEEYYLRLTTKGNNIIHIAIRYEQYNFIEATLNKFHNNYEIISRENSNGNTPLHIAAEVGKSNIVKLVYDRLENMVRIRERNEKPWRSKNSKGNTPVHVALIHGNVMAAKFLLDKDTGLASIVNDSQEAPLHVAIKQHVSFSESQSIIASMKQPINEGGTGLAMGSAEENMSSIIEFLIEIASNVAKLPDATGLTPLHRAASLNIPYNLQITKFMIENCPQSTEVFDASGKSILHHLIRKVPNYSEGKKLLAIEEIHALRNYQDHQGNTPLHIAAAKDVNVDVDVVMVRVLLESSTKCNINNSIGICAASLIQQNNVLQKLRQRNLTEEESEAANTADITILKDRMKTLGMNFLLSQDPNGKNVLHKLLEIKSASHIKQDEFVNFTKQILRSFPKLLYQKDENGNTPIHILVRNDDTKIHVASQSPNNSQQTNTETENFVLTSFWKSELLLELLNICNEFIQKIQLEACNNGSWYTSPWMMQNADGNTPLHEALLKRNKSLVMKLLEHIQLLEEWTTLPNNRKETPREGGEQFLTKDIEKLVEVIGDVAHCTDEDGFTPIQRAFEVGNISTATILCNLFPKAAEIGDANGQIFWHLIVKHPSIYHFYILLQNEVLRKLLVKKDNKGNTILHLAIANNRFDILEAFLETWGNRRDNVTKDKEQRHEPATPMDIEHGRKKEETLRQLFIKILDIQNNVGATPADLIAESQSLPSHIEKSIKDKYEMIGVRSVWGIPTIHNQMKTYVNTLGIIAALLATITFTAAFNVPGGLLEDIGTPIMLGKAAFQVFMISDVIAMCLSMMVLVCLLRIMATNNKRDSVVILDVSITLLLASFYATLVTFATGLFAAMFTVKPWIAIVTLVLCSLVMVLVHKFFFINLYKPFKKATLYASWTFLQFARRLWTQLFKRKPTEEVYIVGVVDRNLAMNV